MNAEIFTVGTEFLLGASVDTNSAWIARELAALGFNVTSIRTVGDNERDLEEAFHLSLQKNGLVVVTGGLGPTVDDVTRRVAAKAAGRPLVYREDLARLIEEFFKKRNKPCPQVNLSQAFTPQGSILVMNPLGTAPGFIVKAGKGDLVVLPGVPSEMRAMFEGGVGPYLRERYPGGSVVKSRVYRTTGMGESKLNEVIRDVFEGSQNPSVSVTAHPEGVDIRLTARAGGVTQADQLLDALGKTIMARLPNHVYGLNEDGLESVVGRLLKMRHSTLAVVESCTGGLISRRLTSVSGSSDYFLRGIIAYSNESKTDLLQVDPELIRSRGAVSADVAKALARNGRVNARSSLAVSTTGIAGPSGGTDAKPVGLVYLALADEAGTQVFEHRFPGDRDAVQRRAAQAVLELLRRYCLGLPLED